jgi:hypothetical protein
MSKLVAAFASSHSVMLPGYRTPALTGTAAWKSAAAA